MEHTYNGEIIIIIRGALCSDIKTQMKMLITGPGGEMTESEIEDCVMHTGMQRNEVCQPGPISQSYC